MGPHKVKGKLFAEAETLKLQFQSILNLNQRWPFLNPEPKHDRDHPLCRWDSETTPTVKNKQGSCAWSSESLRTEKGVQGTNRVIDDPFPDSPRERLRTWGLEESVLIPYLKEECYNAAGANYKPISLTCVVSKIMDLVVTSSWWSFS